jgi:diaminopimelate epimerase
VTWFAADGSGVWRARFWERSVGETMSCGTGVAAILSAGVRLQVVKSNAVVVTAGGPIRAEMDPGGSVHITGRVAIACVGDWVMR